MIKQEKIYIYKLPYRHLKVNKNEREQRSEKKKMRNSVGMIAYANDECYPFDSFNKHDVVDIKSEVYPFRASFHGMRGYEGDWFDNMIYSEYFEYQAYNNAIALAGEEKNYTIKDIII